MTGKASSRVGVTSKRTITWQLVLGLLLLQSSLGIGFGQTFTYRKSTTPSSSGAFLTQANAQGAAGYQHIPSIGFGSPPTDFNTFYIKESAKGSATFTYRALTPATTSAGFLAQANAQGSEGFAYVGTLGFGSYPQLNFVAVYVKDSSKSSATYAYRTVLPAGTPEAFVTQANTQGTAGYKYLGGMAFGFSTVTAYMKDSSKGSAVYTYRALSQSNTAGDMINLANTQGAARYQYLHDLGFGAYPSVVFRSIFIRDSSSADTFSYKALTPSASATDFLNQANLQGVGGNQWKGNLGFGNYPSIQFATIYVRQGPPDSQPPVILSQPTSQTVQSGQNVSLRVTAVGGTSLTFQWRKNQQNIPGATASAYTIPKVQPTHAGTYDVLLRNAHSAKASAKAVVTVCNYTLSQQSAVFPTSGGDNTINVNATAGCNWSATENSDWITITGETSSSVSYSVAANSGRPRSGLIVVAGRTHAVAQLGAVPTDRFDFSGDHSTDLLLQRSDGVFAAWKMMGTNTLETVLLRNGVSAGPWRGFGVGDFNDDGEPDIALLHSSTGKLSTWFMQETNLLGSGLLRNGTAIPAGTRPVAVTDFNGDGKADLLLENTNRTSTVWFMNGTNYIGAARLRNGLAAGAGWQMVGTGDFNADAQTDIVLQHTDGRLAVWHFIGVTYLHSSPLRTGPIISSGWRIKGVADFDGDGKTDLFWHKTDGQTMLWLFNNTTYLKSVPLRKLGTTWQVVGPR